MAWKTAKTASDPSSSSGHCAWDRRRLLTTLLHSSLIPAATSLWPGRSEARPALAVPDSARQALDIGQLRSAAREALADPAWHFVVGGSDAGKTVAANREAFDRWQIRVRRLVDVSNIDTSVTVLGTKMQSPILLAPIGSQQRLHGRGELAVAQAAGKRGHVMICSTVSSFSIGEIAANATAPLWFQLYPSPDEALMIRLIEAAEHAGCRVLVVTVDSPTRGNRIGERWFDGARSGGRIGNFEGIAGRPLIGNAKATWDIVAWLREHTDMQIALKGIVTREDAALCVAHGVDGVIVSNHGGRQEESGRGTLDSLPEVLEGVEGKLPVLIDGGFRRGTDIFKALALGARAICIGRPYLYGLAAFGQVGVERSLSILDEELRRIMQLAGTTSLAAITHDYVVKN